MKFLFILFILVMFFLVACTQIQTQCENNGGKFLEGSNECEKINQDACSSMGGNFDDCASSCRNNPESQFCTSECVPVCTL